MKYWLVIALVMLSLQSFAQESSVVEKSVVESLVEKTKTKSYFYESKALDMLEVGVPLLALGLVAMPAREDFQNIRQTYCEDVRFYADDYIQYSPAFLMLGLKAAGVESRSSWGRLLVTDAITVAVMSIMANSVKRTIKVARPEGGSYSSMPSGHTATAFMTATMLHKEYGAVSPWYSVAGYSVAAATGAMRVINNQHWVSDVLVGAGIGIIATEIGYLLGDLIYKDRGINRDLDDTFNPTWDTISSKSSVGFYLGFAQSLNQFTSSTKINMGTKIGVDGFYLFDGRFGVGAGAAISEFSLDLNGVYQEEESLDIISANVGGYYAQPITKCWRVGAKLIAGVDYYDRCELENEFSISKGARAAFGGGASIEYIANKHWAIKAFADYNAAYVSDLPNTNLHQTAVFGASGSVIF